MRTDDAFNELMQFQRDTEALMSIAGRLGWDQRLRCHEALQIKERQNKQCYRVVHKRNTDPRIADWLDRISPNNGKEAANIRLIKKGYERDCKVPTELNASIAEVTSKAHGIWASARQNENVPEYLPILAEIIKLKIEKVPYRGWRAL